MIKKCPKTQRILKRIEIISLFKQRFQIVTKAIKVIVNKGKAEVKKMVFIKKTGRGENLYQSG